MNIDILAALARLRIDDLLDDASKRRLRRSVAPTSPSIRAFAASLLRGFGAAAIDLGDAVAPRSV